MSCSDLCTAAKCQELENRIGALEQALELLEAAFEAHTQQDIPEAHGLTLPEPEPIDLSNYCTIAECGEIYQGLLSAPLPQINKIISDFALIQSKINNAAICDIGLTESQDVVSLVASDNVLGRATDKFLVLHLVTFDNYPKRSRGSTYWQVQIPKVKDEYIWNEDFLNLSWNRGNLYCELYFDGIRDPVSGWFSNKDAADVWFNLVVNLTTAIEKNRKYHEQKQPKRNIESNTIRPYRAFISEINDVGRTICHVKYVPPIKNE